MFRQQRIRALIGEADREIFKLQEEITSLGATNSSGLKDADKRYKKAEFRAHLCRVMFRNYEKAGELTAGFQKTVLSMWCCASTMFCVSTKYYRYGHYMEPLNDRISWLYCIYFLRSFLLPGFLKYTYLACISVGKWVLTCKV